MTKRKFDCDFELCGKSFSQSAFLTAHYRIHTGERPFICDFKGCNAAFAQDSNLKKHMMIHTNIKPFVCQESNCIFACRSKQQMDTHERTHTGERPFVCDFKNCNMTFIRQGALTYHQRTHTGDWPFECASDGCDFKTVALSKLNQHTKTVHLKERAFLCDVDGCNLSFGEKCTLMTHKLTHTNIFPFLCAVEQCEFKCRTKTQFMVHMKRHTQVKDFHCTFENCKLSFVDSGELQKHIRSIHTKEKAFVCDFEGCTYATSRKDCLNQHKNIHMKTKPFKCDLPDCDKTFAKSQSLQLHMKLHSGIKDFVCSHPGCTFSTHKASNLAAHVNRHSSNKSHECEFEGCGFKTTTKKLLKLHKLQHSDKQFKCDSQGCLYVASQRYILALHKQRVHEDVRPHCCGHCGKAFHSRSKLNVHENMHERQKRFKFPCLMQDGGTQLWQKGDVECTIRCESQRTMDYHVQRNHTLEGIAAKFQSETKLARFFENQEIAYDRDWVNRLQFKYCKNIEAQANSARPDFYLLAESVRLDAAVLVGNDEFAHRSEKCDFQRTFNIVQALEQTEEYRNVKIIYVRFNPHAFRRGTTFFDMKLEDAHNLLLKTIRGLDETMIKAGLNLIYVNYDWNENAELEIFAKCNNKDNDFAEIMEPCVLLSV